MHPASPLQKRHSPLPLVYERYLLLAGGECSGLGVAEFGDICRIAQSRFEDFLQFAETNRDMTDPPLLVGC